MQTCVANFCSLAIKVRKSLPYKNSNFLNYRNENSEDKNSKIEPNASFSKNKTFRKKTNFLKLLWLSNQDRELLEEFHS